MLRYILQQFRVECFVPRPDHALDASRSSNDRLLTFVNHRPVTIAGVNKVCWPRREIIITLVFFLYMFLKFLKC